MNMAAKKWNKLSFFWQVYWFTVVHIIIIVASVEILWEELALPVFIHTAEGLVGEYETILWLFIILTLSPVSAFAISRFIENKLKGLAENSNKLSRGDFSARVDNSEHHDDAFGKIVSTFNAMAQQLESLFMVERRLLTDISHELRSPLTRINMALALAEKNAGNDTRPLLEFIENETEHMSELVLLLLQQGRQSLMSTEQGQIDLKELLESVVAKASFEGKEKQRSITCSTAGDLTIYGSGIGLRRLFTNIIDNALKYTPPETSVNICAERQQENILVEIRDYGPGVPEPMLEDIFRAFFRVDDSRARDTGGVGLGLAIAKQMVQSHGGTITACNAQPGLKVNISLPTQHKETV